MPNPVMTRRVLLGGKSIRVPPRLDALYAAFDLVGGVYTDGTNQVLTSLYGRTPTLQRGATTGAEASDPSVGATGWGFVTDDYGLTPNLTGVDMAGDWTAMVFGLFNGTELGYCFGLSDPTTNTEYQTIRNPSSGAINVRTASGGPVTDSDSVAVSTTSSVAVAFRSNAGFLTLKRCDTGVEVSVASSNPTGTPLMTVGGVKILTGSYPVNAMTGSLVLFWHSIALSDAQVAQAHWWGKRYLTRKGVVVL